jgi:hypothetical protein
MAEPLKKVISQFNAVVSTVATTTPGWTNRLDFIQEFPLLVTKPQSQRHRADDPSSAEWGRVRKAKDFT